jgi:hypothetical protein
VHYVPRHLLPNSWIINEADRSFNLPDIDLETGHTLVHHLYTKAYDRLNDSTFESSTPSANLKHALRVYIATINPQLSDLNFLAIYHIQIHAEHMSIFEILDAVKEDFTRLTHLDSDGLVHTVLREKVEAAFEKDHTIFRNEALLSTVDNAVLGKLVMKWVTEIYDEKIKRMFAVERVMEANVKDWMDKYTSVLQKLHNAGCGDEVQQGVVDECCAIEASEHGSVGTEEFRTISCLSEEDSERDDRVIVDEGDLSESVEVLNNEVEDTEAVCEEAVCGEAVCEEAVCGEAVCEEAVCEEAVCEEAVCEEAVCGEAVCEEAVCEEAVCEEAVCGEAVCEEAVYEKAAHEDTVAANSEPVTVEEEHVVNPFAWLTKSQKKKLQDKMRTEAQREEEEAMRIEEENAAEVERIRLEEARLREEEETAAAIVSEENLAHVVAAEDAVADAEPKVCPQRARHMIKEKRWMKCSSCRAAVQHMAIRLSRTNVDEETLQDLEKELFI